MRGSSPKKPSAFVLRQSQEALHATRATAARKRDEAGREATSSAYIPANETEISRRRREQQEKDAYDRKLAWVTRTYKARQEEQQKYDALKGKARRLQSRLHNRPNDLRSLSLLVDVVYEMKDYLASVQVLHKALRHPELQAESRLYILLGRCHLRRWRGDGTVPDLTLALDAYREAMRDPDLHRAAVSSPVPYFELAGLLLRLGKHQMALDTMGAVLQIFKDRDDWAYIAQYNVAQVLLLLGDGEAALKIYQTRLMLCPLLVEPEELRNSNIDHCILLSTRMFSTLVSVEVAILQRRQGQPKLAVSLLKECFDRQTRVLLFPEHQGGGDPTVDIRFAAAASDWKGWISSPSTFKQLGDLFRRELNVAMAAEAYGIAAELFSKLGGWGREEADKTDDYSFQKGSSNSKSYSSSSSNSSNNKNSDIKFHRSLASLILDRGECMAELHNAEQAEHCALVSFELLPLDVVVVGRAARCCMRGAVDFRAALQDPALPETNKFILDQAIRVMRAVGFMTGLLRVQVAKRRREAKLELGKYATKISSVIRMCLVRNRTAAARLDIVATGRVGRLAHQLRGVWRTGRVALEMYLELWNLSVKGIQHLIRMFLFRRRISRVSRAITTCKTIWRGQVARRAMRASIARIQATIEAGVETDAEAEFEFETEAKDHGKNNVDEGRDAAVSESLRYHPFGGITDTRLQGIERLSAGVNIITNDQNLPIVHDQELVGQVSVASKRRAARRLPPQGLRSSSLGSAWFSSVSGLPRPPLSSALLAATASFCSQEELEAHVRSCRSLGEDVPCLLGIRSVLDDATVRWVPFCIVPDEGVRRLLTATALMLTAQSFSVIDCMRIVYVVRQRQQIDNDTFIWQCLRSLFIQGTHMGPRGFSYLMSLGLRHLHTLSLSGIGLMPLLGVTLGQMLANSLPSNVGGGCALTKLYIESELKFGNRGVMALMKYLQYNTSLRILSLRDCRLKRDCVPSITSYLSLSTHLEVLHLSDNLFKMADCRVLVRSVANKGIKGAFRSLYLQGISLSLAELEHIYTEGLSLGVNVVTPIGERKELLGEIRVRDYQGDAESKKQQEVKKIIDLRLRLHQLDISEPNLTQKEVIF